MCSSGTLNVRERHAGEHTTIAGSAASAYSPTTAYSATARATTTNPATTNPATTAYSYPATSSWKLGEGQQRSADCAGEHELCRCGW
jgi:hypothetical protein